jgi:hypothetical protein
LVAEDFRFLRLRRDGICVGCGVAVRAGTGAWWDPEGRTVTCAACRPFEPGRAAASPAQTAISGKATEDVESAPSAAYSRFGLRLRPWELALAAVGELIGAAYLIVGPRAVGVGIALAVILWLVTRLHVQPSLEIPGYLTTMRGRIGVAKTLLLAGVYGAVTWAAFVVRDDPLRSTRLGTIATFALVGVTLLLARELKEAVEDAGDWLLGGRAERTVGRQLDQLRERGWLVLHGYQRDYGDIDHIVCGPNGAFAIETKSHRFRRSNLGQAAGNAAWLKQHLGVSWVTAVLCVADGPTPRKSGVVWIVGHDQLVRWLEERRDTPVDAASARQLLSYPGATGAAQAHGL